MPADTPMAASVMPRTRTMRATSAGADPSASRTAHSRRREVTLWATTPYKPDCRQQQRQRREPSHQPAIQVQVPERVRHDLLHGPDVENRDARIDVEDSRAHGVDHPIGTARRADDKRHAEVGHLRPVLRHRKVDFRNGRTYRARLAARLSRRRRCDPGSSRRRRDRPRRRDTRASVSLMTMTRGDATVSLASTFRPPRI